MKKNLPAGVRRGRDSALWYDPALPLKLGCTVCPDLAICGGLRVKAGLFDCRTLCACNCKRCSGLCRRDPRIFVRRVQEVRGFELDNVPRCGVLTLPPSAEYVPIIYDGTSRDERLDAGVAALPLAGLFNRVTGRPKFRTRAELLAAYGLAPRTRIVMTGVAPDREIESWWSFPNRPELIAGLKDLGIDMVTSPNYSLFTNVARYDNLHNMKRIALACAEFMAGGIPCALHVNGRTDMDYERWAAYVAGREEIDLLAFEFTTGTASTKRGLYHRDHLARIAERAGRPLHLVVRGGQMHLPALTAAFASVSILDGEAFVKTKYRKRACLAIGADIDWRSSPTKEGETLDALLRHNIAMKRVATSIRLGWIRADYGHAKAGHTRSLLEARPA